MKTTKDESIRNYIQKHLTLANFIELPNFIILFMLTPLINFRSEQLYPTLVDHLIIYLNILRSYYLGLAYERTQLKFKNIVSLDSDWKLVSFDVSSFFTSVPLDFTMDVILRWNYRNKEIVAHITLNESKELILLFKSLFTKRLYCNGVFITTWNSWHFYGWIGKRIFISAILLYNKLDTLRERHYCLH